MNPQPGDAVLVIGESLVDIVKTQDGRRSRPQPAEDDGAREPVQTTQSFSSS